MVITRLIKIIFLRTEMCRFQIELRFYLILALLYDDIFCHYECTNSEHILGNIHMVITKNIYMILSAQGLYRSLKVSMKK